MNYLEAIKEDLRPFEVSSRLITRKCEKNGVTATEEVADEAKVTLMEIEILSQMITMTSVSEGGVSKSFDKEAAILLLRRLCVDAGVDESLYVKTSSVKYLEDWS